MHWRCRELCANLEDFAADERLLEAAALAGFLDVFSGSGNIVEFLLSTYIVHSVGWKNSEKSILQCINQPTTHLLLNRVRLRGEGRDGVGASEQRDDTATFAGPLVLRVGARHTNK